MANLAQQAALAAIAHLPRQTIIGIGTGSTVNYLIDAIADQKIKLEGIVASSEVTAAKLKAIGIPLVDLNHVGELSVYIDGADRIDAQLRMLKGGGGAMTREKIIATCAKKFICIAAADKFQPYLTTTDTPISIEVLPMARSYVARQLVKLGAAPIYRTGFVTDNSNVVLDVFNLDVFNPLNTEQLLNNITGVVAHGLFAARCADLLFLSTDQGVQEIRVAP